ncbi:MAG: GyrI-like domain-containing protein [Pseudomonadota bacterium]
MDFERKEMPEQHYLYVDREASFSKNDIAEAMGSGFGAVFAFNAENGVTPLSMPTSIYMEMPSGDAMTFRAGVFVSAEDAGKASGEIKSATMPAGEVVSGTHVGPYANLNQSHKALWDYVEREGLGKAMPVWEIYVDDPTTVPEDKLRTEIYRVVGG